MVENNKMLSIMSDPSEASVPGHVSLSNKNPLSPPAMNLLNYERSRNKQEHMVSTHHQSVISSLGTNSLKFSQLVIFQFYCLRRPVACLIKICTTMRPHVLQLKISAVDKLLVLPL